MPASRDGLRICLLTTQDLDAKPFAEDDWPCDPRPFLPDADWHLETLAGKRACLPVVERLVADERFDLFFNLCDGAADQPELPGIEVVEILEGAGVPFVGAVSACYEPSRDRMKQACRARGIATPASATVHHERDLDRAVAALRYPLFVKHPSSYASVDLSRRSKACSPNGLRIQVRKMIARHGAALVEEYVDGRECTVLVVENPDDPRQPIVYPPIEYRFPPGEHFKHESLKWVDYDALACEPVADPVLAERLARECGEFFVELGAASFARCDLRVDRDGVPFMLEINANCGVYFPPTDYGSADLCIANDPGGHAAFTRTLVAAAFARHERRSRQARRSSLIA